MTLPTSGPDRVRSESPDRDHAARDPVSYRFTLAMIALALVIAGGLAFAIDLPVASWCKTHRLPGELARLLNFAEVGGHALGVAVLLAVAIFLDRTLRPLPLRPTSSSSRDLARIVSAAYAGGLVVDTIKASVDRVRPRAADLTSFASALATFGDGAAATATGRGADLMSFPSGHAAVAAGFAAALGWKYPHGRPLFALLAAAAAAQRVVTSAHYPSDVAFGAALGLVGAFVCLGSKPPETL